MDVAAVIVAVGTVALEEDHVAAVVAVVDQVITTLEADMAVEIAKAMVKGPTRIMSARATEAIAMEWIVDLTTKIVPTIRATTVEVATKATMVNATTRVGPTTDHRATNEGVRPMLLEVGTVVVHLGERPEEVVDLHPEVVVTIETNRTRKSKEDGGHTRIVPSYFVLK